MAILKSRSGTSYDTETGIRTNTDGTTTQVGNTITSENLQNPGTPVIPAPPQSPVDYNAIVNGAASSVTAPVAEKPDTTYTDKAKSLIESIVGGSDSLEGKTAYEQQQLEKSGATGYEKRRREIAGQLTTMNNETLAKKLEREKNKEGTYGGVIAQDNAQYDRDNAIKALSLQAEDAVLAGNLTTAKETAQRAVDLKYGDLEASIDRNTKLLQLYSPFMTLEQQKIAEKRQEENEAKKTELADKKKLQGDILNLAQESGQSDIAAGILKLDPTSATFSTDLSALQGKIYNPDTALTQLENGNTVLVDKRTGKVIRNIGGAKPKTEAPIVGLTVEQQNDPFIKKLVATAGGKPLTDTPLISINKGLTVLGQLGVLQTNIKDVKTGPITGAFKGLNPWNTEAQTIKAQLNAIVPNLARGVYGEVGVLTDNDIKTYSQTLPNLKSTEDVRNAVLGITIDLIGKSIKNTLEVQAAGGRDVSGFVDLYTSMTATRDSIFSQIPGYKGKGSSGSNMSADEFINAPIPGSASTITVPRVQVDWNKAPVI